ncbi:hypothetical protein FUAX_51600 (plasmid) [Fulvitalea axinellae]|uniref:Outer membrane protein beta-barrel domain-containing protein n=1 Tax=Fulvitalea axinellae TaxID=1182444 RepID=A0AAU9D9Z1_9BACT|nr:hypothetical protein FUAX_51600 [Fulvitalea axinellae]
MLRGGLYYKQDFRGQDIDLGNESGLTITQVNTGSVFLGVSRVRVNSMDVRTNKFRNQKGFAMLSWYADVMYAPYITHNGSYFSPDPTQPKQSASESPVGFRIGLSGSGSLMTSSRFGQGFELEYARIPGVGKTVEAYTMSYKLFLYK